VPFWLVVGPAFWENGGGLWDLGASLPWGEGRQPNEVVQEAEQFCFLLADVDSNFAHTF